MPPRNPSRRTRLRLSSRQLKTLAEQAIVDAHDESEQQVGFLCMLQEHVVCPFTTNILGSVVTVERIDSNEVEEIVAVCRRQRHRQLIPIVDLPMPTRPPAGWEWIEAYRYWSRGSR